MAKSRHSREISLDDVNIIFVPETETDTYSYDVLKIDSPCLDITINAKQLYAWLKEHYGADEENVVDDGRQYTCAASMY